MKLVSKEELLKRRPPNPERVAEYKRAMELQIKLHELRERRHVTQAEVAEATEIEDDIRVSTLARYIKAMGGRVEIRAVFDDERVELY